MGEEWEDVDQEEWEVASDTEGDLGWMLGIALTGFSTDGVWVSSKSSI